MSNRSLLCLSQFVGIVNKVLQRHLTVLERTVRAKHLIVIDLSTLQSSGAAVSVSAGTVVQCVVAQPATAPLLPTVVVAECDS